MKRLKREAESVMKIMEQNVLDSDITTQGTHTSKKSKMVERVVVAVKIEKRDKKHKSEDCWSWRKYGQKPIKGSPYPRGYYRCSTSKGCLAKKQVDRCKTDASMIIITYTATHNHSCSGNLSTIDHHKEDEVLELQESPLEEETKVCEDTFHYSQSPFNSSQDIININHRVNQQDNPFDQENLETTPIHHVVVDQDSEPLCHDSSTVVLKSYESEVYDDLEELPTSSFLTSFMRSSFCEEGILVNPSSS